MSKYIFLTIVITIICATLIFIFYSIYYADDNCTPCPTQDIPIYISPPTSIAEDIQRQREDNRDRIDETDREIEDTKRDLERLYQALRELEEKKRTAESSP